MPSTGLQGRGVRVARDKRRSVWLRPLVLVGLIIAAGVLCWATMLRMPGESHRGPLPALAQAERELTAELREDVTVLAEGIGERNVAHPQALDRAARHIERALVQAGYRPQRQSFQVAGVDCHNLEVEIPGKSSSEIVVVGAHYDTALGAPGANDNGSGVAAVLALARRLAKLQPERTLRFVAFVNEEPPHFQTDDMGSLRYARRSRERGENIAAMLSLETMGYFDDSEGSQVYPPPIGFFYPSTGDFVGFVANLGSRRLLREVIADFRSHTPFPSEGAALPAVIPGVGWSDHWAFWKAGYPALMITDTAPFRYPHYHTAADTPDKLDYERLARVVAGIERVVRKLARG